MLFESILSSSNIGIFTHTNPDGDALGSTLGLMGWLDDRGIRSTIFLPSAISESLEFTVPDSHRGRIVVWDGNKPEACNAAVAACDLLIGLDFNHLSRIGEWSGAFSESRAGKILIDHHIQPETEAFDHVISRTDVSSTCEIVYFLLKDAPGVDGDCSKLNRLTRESLMTGMTTDSNNFANSVYPSTLAMASELLAAGTDRDSIIQKLFFSYPKRRIKAQGYILHRLLHITDDGVAYIFLNSFTQTRFNLKEGDTEGFVNIPLSIDGVRMSILAKRERGSRKIRISIRSKKGTSALECAAEYFHGGGHEQASGGRLTIGEDIPTEHSVCRYIENSTHSFFLER